MARESHMSDIHGRRLGMGRVWNDGSGGRSKVVLAFAIVDETVLLATMAVEWQYRRRGRVGLRGAEQRQRLRRTTKRGL